LALIAGIFFDLSRSELRHGINTGSTRSVPGALKEGQRYRLNVKLGDVRDPQWRRGAAQATVEIEGESSRPALPSWCSASTAWIAALAGGAIQ